MVTTLKGTMSSVMTTNQMCAASWNSCLTIQFIFSSGDNQSSSFAAYGDFEVGGHDDGIWSSHGGAPVFLSIK